MKYYCIQVLATDSSPGERKKSHDKVYPKGYVEMLEQQQTQLVAGLQEMYRRLRNGQQWTGGPLPETNGHPLTHDILAGLDLLEAKHDGSGELESFEEDCARLQSRLLAEGATLMHRRDSIGSDSDHSQGYSQGHAHSISHGTPTVTSAPLFNENFGFKTASPSPLSQSPVPQQRKSFPPAQPSPLQTAHLTTSDRPFFEAEWAIPDMSNPASIMRSRFAMQAPELNSQSLQSIASSMDGYGQQWDTSAMSYDTPMTPSFGQQLPASMAYGSAQGMQEYTSLDPMDLDFSKFIQVQT